MSKQQIDWTIDGVFVWLLNVWILTLLQQLIVILKQNFVLLVQCEKSTLQCKMLQWISTHLYESPPSPTVNTQGIHSIQSSVTAHCFSPPDNFSCLGNL